MNRDEILRLYDSAYSSTYESRFIKNELAKVMLISKSK